MIFTLFHTNENQIHLLLLKENSISCKLSPKVPPALLFWASVSLSMEKDVVRPGALPKQGDKDPRKGQMVKKGEALDLEGTAVTLGNSGKILLASATL